MKNFNEFKNSLTDKIRLELINNAIQTANKKVDEENSSVSEKLIDHQRYFSECLTMELLEKYHEWINE